MMNKLFGFPGGIHPPGNKSQSNPGTLINLPIPEQLVIPLGQHIGKQAKPCVSVNDYVKKGQLIAQADDYISASVHAPTSGHISAIAPHRVPHPSSLDALCITLDTDGLDSWHESCVSNNPPVDNPNSTIDPTNFSGDMIQQRIQMAGIIGMGGAGFPTAVKTAKAQIIDTLIINGVECEPYIAADDTLMQAYTESFIFGVRLLQQLLAVKRCIIAIEDNKPAAITKVTSVLQDITPTTDIELVVIPTKYPSGGEKQLIENITGQQVPTNGLPADLGILCLNVATAKAVYDAVVLGLPSIDRIITVTGDACTIPGNYQVLIGTLITDILEFIKAPLLDQQKPIPTTNTPVRIIMGGPMMGFELPNANVPISKTSNCVLLPEQHQLASNQAMACIRCGQCEVVCPANLLPQQLYWYAKSDAYDKLKEHNLFDCIECGACAYVCPSQIPLVQHYRYAKGTIRNIETEAQLADYARQRFEFREQRLAEEQAAKQQKRIERAAAAAALQAAKRESGKDDPIAAAQARLAAKKANIQSSETPGTEKETPTKALKTSVAITRTKLKKAEKALQEAKMQDHADLAKFEHMVTELQAKLSTAQQALDDAQPNTNASD